MGQVLKKTLVGLATDLSIAIQIGDPFAHRLPPQLAIICLLADFEFARIVDGSLNPQDAVLVVHLE